MAQHSPSTEGSKMAVTNFYLLTGSGAGFSQSGTVSEFSQLAPGSVLLQNNMDGFSETEDNSSGYNGMVSLLLGINFKDHLTQQYKSNPQLRVGLSYSSGTLLTNYLYKEVRSPYDTLTSSQTGQTYLVDSAVWESYDLNYHTEQVLLEASLIYRSRPEARWSLYGGMGFSAGVSINAFTTVDYAKNSGAGMHNPDPHYYYYPIYYTSEGTYLSETNRNESSTALSVFFPLGIDFRIARKNDFWKRMHLFYEMRPGIHFAFIPEIRTVNEAFFQSTFGLRVEM